MPLRELTDRKVPAPLSDLQIAMQVTPNLPKWPSADIARSIAWDKSREAAELLHLFVRTLDAACLQIEANADHTEAAIARNRADLGRRALAELKDWQPLRTAEREIERNISQLEKSMTALPQPPTTVADVMLAQEIRQHVKAQKSPIDFAVKSMSEPRTLGAILTAPAYLAGLSDTEWNMVRDRARTTLHPQQSQMQQELAKSRDDLRGGLEAARRMVRERCQMQP